MAIDPLVGCRVLGFDLETTGFNPKQHRIVQYAFVGCDADGSSIHLEELVNPQMKIPMETTQIHGIQDSDVRGVPTFREFIEEISIAMEGAVIVGHNVERFDWPFLRSEFLRAGQPMPTPLAILDTLKIARKLEIPPSHNLGALCHRFGISLEAAHTAGADAAATLLLLHKMIEANPSHFRRPVEEIPEWANKSNRANKSTKSHRSNLEDLESVIGSHGWLKTAPTGIVIGRGLHRGRAVADLLQTDSNYLDWLGSSAGPLESGAIEALQAERSA